MKKLFLFLMGISIFYQAKSQVITLLDESSLDPIPSALITAAPDATPVLTDAKGRADISGFRGTAPLKIKMAGYLTIEISYAEILNQPKPLIYLKSDPITLEATVISANRFEQDKKDVPQKITTITAAQIALQNPQTTADLLGTSGDVYIQKSQLGGGSPMIRGFATNRVLLTVDGVRMNSAIFRSGNVQNVINLDALTVDKTEVLFGPGSVMYGSDAIGGVMNFYTLKPILSSNNKLADKVNVFSRYSSANSEKTGHFDFTLGGKKFSMLSSVTYSDFDHLRQGSNGPDEFLRPQYAATINGKDTLLNNPDPLVQNPSGYYQWNYMQKLRYKPTEKWDINYAFHYSQIGSYARYDRLIRPGSRGQGLRSAEWAYGPQIWAMNNLMAEHSSEGIVYDKLRITLAHQYFQESRIERDFNRSNRFTRTEEVEAWSANLDLEKSLSDKHKLFYGTEYIRNLVNSRGVQQNVNTGIIQPASSRYPDGSDWTSVGVYLNHRFKVTEKLTLQSGARYSHYGINATFDTTFFKFPFTDVYLNSGSLTGSLGAVFIPEKTWILSLNTATGFRAPNIDDMGKVFDSNPGSVVVPNPNLKSEYSYNIDLGLAKVIAKRVKLDVTGFYTYLDNALARTRYQFNGQDSVLYNGVLSQVEAITNTSYGEVIGIQAGIDIALPAGFTIASKFNWMKGTEFYPNGSSSRLNHTPPNFGISRLSYRRKKLMAEVYIQYNGKVLNKDLSIGEATTEYLMAKDSEGKPWFPSWMTWNFKTSYHFNSFISLSGGVENITDLRYRPYGSGISAPGRNFILSLRGTF